jgi:hypothetical protein
MGNYSDFSEISGLFQKSQFWATEGTYFVTLVLNLPLTLSIQNIHSNQLIFNVPPSDRRDACSTHYLIFSINPFAALRASFTISTCTKRAL